MKRPLPLLTCLALLAAPGVRAEVHEALDYDHYEAHAQPGHPLAQALNEASPCWYSACSTPVAGSA